MDEWQVDLISIMEEAGLEPTPDQRREMALGRYWLCVAIDCATRCIIGIKLTTSASTKEALATLWLAMIDKTEMARAMGCLSDWSQFGHIGHLVVDNGSSFTSAEFKASLADLGIQYSVMPAGVPKLRGRVERVLLTFIRSLMPYLTGRTFSNPVERGDYPSEAYAVHTAQGLLDAFVRYIVDHYHQREHQGLDYNSPAQAWAAAAKTYPVKPAHNRHVLRAILGIEVERRSGRHGVQLFRLKYHSENLARHFMHHGGQDMRIRLDPEDLGHVSCWFNDGWHVLSCTTSEMQGVSLDAWTRSVTETLQGNRAAARSGQILIDDAVRGIRAIDAAARAHRRLGPINLSQEEIERADRNLFMGVRFGDDQSSPQQGNRLPGRLIGGSIPFNQQPVSKQPDTDSTLDWRFSDDQD